MFEIETKDMQATIFFTERASRYSFQNGLKLPHGYKRINWDEAIELYTELTHRIIPNAPKYQRKELIATANQVAFAFGPSFPR